VSNPIDFPKSPNNSSNKPRDVTNYIAAAKKNKWIKHVKKCSKVHKVDYKTALALATKKYHNKKK
jgi:hypothetical protein